MTEGGEREKYKYLPKDWQTRCGQQNYAGFWSCRPLWLGFLFFCLPLSQVIAFCATTVEKAEKNWEWNPELKVCSCGANLKSRGLCGSFKHFLKSSLVKYEGKKQYYYKLDLYNRSNNMISKMLSQSIISRVFIQLKMEIIH